MTRLPRPEPPKVGNGYRELQVGEKVQAGDEFTVGGLDCWMPAAAIGTTIRGHSVRHRRKIESGKAAA